MASTMPKRPAPQIGLALGAGAARGWAHIGVIRALEEAGIVPDIVCGCSMGALVGAAYAAGRLDEFERWARNLDRSTVIGLFDVSLRGGLIQAKRVFDYLANDLPDVPVRELPRVFGAVATDLDSGAEVWLREGSLHDALRASVALPGLISPARVGGRWLVDGGLVDPVPVSLCRALGAEVVIASELGAGMLTNPMVTHHAPPARRALAPADVEEVRAPSPDAFDLPPPQPDGGLMTALGDIAERLRAGFFNSAPAGPDPLPTVYDVIAKSLLIMQVRITRSRMAGDPPELHVIPRLQHISLLEFDRADEAIPEGHRAVQAALAAQADFRGEQWIPSRVTANTEKV